jgi:hypothetical protein
LQLLFDNSDEHVGGDGTPDLRLHGVLAVSQKTLDSQVLLDPFEEQLHLPAVLVKLGDDRCRQRRVVRQKNQRLARFGIFESHPAQMLGIVPASVMPAERHRLIAHHASGLVYLGRVHRSGVEIGFGASDKEGSRLLHLVQTREIQIAPIHDVESASFEGQDVEHIDIAHVAIADVNEAGNGATQVQQCVQLDSRFCKPLFWLEWVCCTFAVLAASIPDEVVPGFGAVLLQPLVKAGDDSYSTYLLHGFLMGPTARILSFFDIYVPTQWFAALLVIVCTVAGVYCFRYFELSIQGALSNLWNARRVTDVIECKPV